jgi:hypothetical protein
MSALGGSILGLFGAVLLILPVRRPHQETAAAGRHLPGLGSIRAAGTSEPVRIPWVAWLPDEVS